MFGFPPQACTLWFAPLLQAAGPARAPPHLICNSAPPLHRPLDWHGASALDLPYPKFSSCKCLAVCLPVTLRSTGSPADETYESQFPQPWQICLPAVAGKFSVHRPWYSRPIHRTDCALRLMWIFGAKKTMSHTLCNTPRLAYGDAALRGFNPPHQQNSLWIVHLQTTSPRSDYQTPLRILS
jgi:hypothetical protein